MAFLTELVFKRLIRTGTLFIAFPEGRIRRFGTGRAPVAGMRINTSAAERGLVRNPGLAFGESFMDGAIEPLDCSLYELLYVLMTNMNDDGHVVERVAATVRYARRQWSQFNTHRSSRHNVAHHYDLGNDFYRLFLDDDWQYSCAYFRTGNETLEQAQRDKKLHIAAKLRLDRPDLEVLDIGCGWGGMALTLARDFGARVTGITLSDQQLDVARERAAKAGLSDRVHFEKCDYRDVARRFDRIVSVGMFEHVGIGHFPRFFRMIRDCLRDDGVALVHSIGRKDGAGSTNPWIAKYIFPGGYAPALSETLTAVERSGLWVTDCEVLRLHYAHTIALWRERFEAQRDGIRAMYDERFCRMFELYLAAAELSFRVQGHMNFQLQLTRDILAVPITRDAMFSAEQASG
ncbi:class I SAM-dependent methyltransferase [Ameyamaea chiangmaiensis]|uniref:Class I SAM-dependent methyltransferase n=1 Tax=Ameyamaea chiangmaiensis TaxID=442969 RepID=A0A850PD49_9PROT|nr:cyclopropane-fatty-acyl-phospholipid synthase family protein [Ameyamaea chiangmaiensis]MBS4075383.1 class I SAM-dependent methyltransferase [Ameyamaea chiangmaiensis]NVN39872.1 class I SAM-dependent methyltransferase [Ameyamaea chiangmaiensis]